MLLHTHHFMPFSNYLWLLQRTRITDLVFTNIKEAIEKIKIAMKQPDKQNYLNK